MQVQYDLLLNLRRHVPKLGMVEPVPRRIRGKEKVIHDSMVFLFCCRIEEAPRNKRRPGNFRTTRSGPSVSPTAGVRSPKLWQENLASFSWWGLHGQSFPRFLQRSVTSIKPPFLYAAFLQVPCNPSNLCPFRALIYLMILIACFLQYEAIPPSTRTSYVAALVPKLFICFESSVLPCYCQWHHCLTHPITSIPPESTWYTIY